MTVNVWGNVAGNTAALPMVSLLGLTGQLMGMNAAATAVEYKLATFLNNQLATPIGSAAAPSHTFTGDLGTGIYQNGAGKFAIACAGAQAVQWDSTLGIETLSMHLRFNGKLLQEAMSADIAAVANLDLGTATGNYVRVVNNAGNLTITRLGGNATLPAGTDIECKFVINGGSVTLKNDAQYLSLPGGSDLLLGNGDIVRFRKTNSFDQFWELVSYNKFQSLQIVAVAQQPITLIYPDINDRPAMVAGGWKPWNLNQQWGGAGCMPFHMVDSATGVEYKFDAFDGYMNQVAQTRAVGIDGARYYAYQSITPAKNLSLNEVWIKAWKNGNPVDNLTLQLWSVAAGSPNAVIATANVINGKQITSDPNGQWYRFVFPAVQALVAGTQYVFVLFKSAGVDAANYYNVWGDTTTKYPNNLGGQGTSVPVWTIQNAISLNFLAVAQASDQPIQSAGTFDGRIVGSGTGNPINRSVGYCNDIRNILPLFQPQGWSILIRGKSWNKDCTIADFLWGLHHDRINVRSLVASGFIQVNVYDKNSAITTITGVSDVSTNSYKDILITGRSLGDGADYLRIYVGINNNWTKEAEVTAQTFSFDPLMLRNGTAWIMGGFPLFPKANYSNFADMSVLPSGAPGYTFNGTAIEGNVFAVTGNKLYQIKSGFAAADTGFYAHGAAGFNTAVGNLIATRFRVTNNTNTKDKAGIFINAFDGTRGYSLQFGEYWASYVQNGSGNPGLFFPQIDNKTTDVTYFSASKGTDALLFANGRLLCDCTGVNTFASGSNSVNFGDNDNTAGENSDAVWSYVGYCNTAAIYPQFTTGELHEFATFPGEQATLGQVLYNAGQPVSVKQYCGVGKNFAGEQIKQIINQLGITPNATIASATFATQPEMECFALGAYAVCNSNYSGNNGALAVLMSYGLHTDNKYLGGDICQISSPGVGYDCVFSVFSERPIAFGLHKIEGRWACSGNTQTRLATEAVLNVGMFAYPK
jgi:hypothetical protein